MFSSQMPPMDIIIDQYLNYLIVEKGLSGATLESYSRDLVRYQKFIQKSGVNGISENDTALILKHMIALRNAGLDARSRARHLVSIRGFYRFAVQEKMLKHDPAGLVDLPKTTLKLPDVLSVEEVSLLLSTPDPTKPIGARDAAMLELIYAAGLRVSELVNLKLQNINLESGFVRVFGKGSQERIVPIGLHAEKKDRRLSATFETHSIEESNQSLYLRRSGGKAHHSPGFLEIVAALWQLVENK